MLQFVVRGIDPTEAKILSMHYMWYFIGGDRGQSEMLCVVIHIQNMKEHEYT